ncbi:MAG: hypothetical protein KAU50_06395 [Candidatus Marinimicrobia bacterium]|nr:hypothetical protein [Candidatus Neomarinimicrobiota bacterium]
MKSLIKRSIVLNLFGLSLLLGQSVQVTEIYFSEFITFYVSSVDIETGATNVDLFELEIAPSNGSVEVQILFKIEIDSAPLGLSYGDNFMTVKTKLFSLDGALRVRNRDLDMNSTQLFYTDPTLGVAPISIAPGYPETIDMEDLEDMQASIIQTGRLPDGNYKFMIEIQDANGNVLDSWERVVTAAHPVALELISPGGPLEDTTNTAITTTYPFFQWQSDVCNVCSYRIRVAEYKAGEHSSLDEAVEDQTVLPLEQALGWFPDADANDKYLPSTSFQYPTSDAIDLEPGKVYAWQVQKILPTTTGEEEINSFIYVFKIADPGQTSTADPVAAAAQDPVMQFLNDIMGDQYSVIFGPSGDLSGFSPTSNFMLDGESIDGIGNLILQLQQNEIVLIDWEVQ